MFKQNIACLPTPSFSLIRWGTRHTRFRNKKDPDHVSTG